MIIRYVHQGYPEKRNILNKSSSTVKRKKTLDIFKILTHISFKLLNRNYHILLNSFWNPFIRKKSQILHLFNGICYSKTSWVTTAEDYLPRFWGLPNFIKHHAAKQLTKTNCKAIILISNSGLSIFYDDLNKIDNGFYSEIKNKTIVLHPPQNLYINDYSLKKISNDIITFTFVGNQFFGKGGREILNVFNKLNLEGYNFKLNIISNFSADSYASHTSIEDIEELKKQIPKLPSSIEILGALSNDKVIDTLKASHIALMPTYADTYGYFILEAQACGCPVITTDIRALSEINNNECGWLINVPKDKLGDGILKTEDQRIEFSKAIETSLFSTLKDIFSNTEIIKDKGEKAIQRIKVSHDPLQHNKKLMKIYSMGTEC